MIGFSILSPIFQNLFNTGLVTKIWHDVSIIVQKDNIKTPVYKQGEAWIPIGLDDTKNLYCYVRQLGDAINLKTELVGSSQKQYKTQVAYRFVFFNAYEKRNFDSLIRSILNIGFGQYVDFIKLITDVQQLQSIEGNIKDFTLSGKAFYIGLDLNVFLKLTKNNCDIEIRCDDIPNPMCGEKMKIGGDGLIDFDTEFVQNNDNSNIATP